MSKTIASHAIWGLLIISTASSYAQDQNAPVSALEQLLNTRIEKLEQKIDDLDQKLNELQTRIEGLTAVPASPVRSVDATVKTKEEPKLSVESWQFREVQVKYNTYYALDLVLHNGYDKVIKDIDGRLKFKNLLGGHLYSISITENLHIPANETIIDEGTQQTGRLLGRGHQMRSINPEEMKTELAIRKIVFEDNSILEF